MEIYCAKCRRKTPTSDIEHEHITVTSKAGKKSERNLVKGTCTICHTKKQQFVSDNKSHSDDNSNSGTGTSTRSRSRSRSGSRSKSSKSAKQHHSQDHSGTGHKSFQVDKKDITKHTYNALKEIIKANEGGKERDGHLTFGKTKYYISPVHVEHIRKAHKAKALKPVAKILSGEKSAHEVMSKMKTKNGGVEIPIISPLLRLFGINT
jgi:hypothetical protein